MVQCVQGMKQCVINFHHLKKKKGGGGAVTAELLC